MISGFDLAAALSGARQALTTRGWHRCVGLLDRDALIKLDHPPSLGWRPLAPQVGRVQMAGWYCQPPIERLPDAVTAFGQQLLSQLRSELRGLNVPASFNEVSWQRHVPAPHAVTPHRDQNRYTGVIAICTLSGAARFGVYDPEHQTDPVETWNATAGDLVLLRGARLAHTQDRCPLHSVDAPTSGERRTITYRHTVGTPGDWE